MVVYELARRAGTSFRSKFNGLFAEARLDGAKVALLKPETWMNEFGGRRRRQPHASSRSSRMRSSRCTTRATSTSAGYKCVPVAASPGTTASARSRPSSGRRSSFGSGSASAGPGAGIRGTSRTSSSPTSSRRTAPRVSSLRGRGRRRGTPPRRVWTRRSAGSTRRLPRLHWSAARSLDLARARVTRPILHSLVEELLGSERLQAYVEALPERARISEPALPLVLRRPARGGGTTRRSSSSPDDGDARDLAEAAGWLLGSEHVGAAPESAVSVGSPVWSRRRTSSVSVRARSTSSPLGGLVFASAAALADGSRRVGARPATIAPASGVGGRASSWLAEDLALAGYERVDRVDDRGQFARPRRSRGRVPGHGPRAAPDRVLRRRDRGRAGVLPVHAARVAPGRGSLRLSGRRAAARPRRDGAPVRRGRRRRPPRLPTISSRRSTGAPTSCGSRTRCAPVWEELFGPIELAGVSELDPFPARPAVRVRGGPRPAIAARGLK